MAGHSKCHLSTTQILCCAAALLILPLPAVTGQNPTDAGSGAVWPEVYNSATVSQLGDPDQDSSSSLLVWSGMAEWLRLRTRGSEWLLERVDQVLEGGRVTDTIADKILSVYTGVAVFILICLVVAVICLIMTPLSLLDGDLCRSYKRPPSQAPSQSLNSSGHDGDWLYKIAIKNQQKSLGSVTLWLSLGLVGSILMTSLVFLVLSNNVVSAKLYEAASMASTSLSQVRNDSQSLAPTMDVTFTTYRGQVKTDLVAEFTAYANGILDVPRLSWTEQYWNPIVEAAQAIDAAITTAETKASELSQALGTWQTRTEEAGEVINPVAARQAALNDPQTDTDGGQYELTNEVDEGPPIILPIPFDTLVATASVDVPKVVPTVNVAFENIVSTAQTELANGVQSGVEDFDTSSYPSLQASIVAGSTSIGNEASSGIDSVRSQVAEYYPFVDQYNYYRWIGTIAAAGVVLLIVIVILLSLWRRSVRLHMFARLLGLLMVAILLILCPVFFTLSLAADEACHEASSARKMQGAIYLADSLDLVTIGIQEQRYINAAYSGVEKCEQADQNGFLEVALDIGDTFLDVTAFVPSDLAITPPAISSFDTSFSLPSDLPTVESLDPLIPNILANSMQGRSGILSNVADALTTSDITFTSGQNAAQQDTIVTDFKAVINQVAIDFANLASGPDPTVVAANGAGNDAETNVIGLNAAISDVQSAITNTEDVLNTQTTNLASALNGKIQELADGVPQFLASSILELAQNISRTPEQRQLNCGWLPAHVKAYEQTVCRGFVRGFDAMWFACMVAAIFLFMGMSLTTAMINKQWGWAK